jgi:hypothetical protein
MFSLRKRNEGKKCKTKKVSVQMMKTQTAELVPLTEIEIYSQFSVVSCRSPLRLRVLLYYIILGAVGVCRYYRLCT